MERYGKVWESIGNVWEVMGSYGKLWECKEMYENVLESI